MILSCWAYKSSKSWNSKWTVFSYNSGIRFHILCPPANTWTWSIFCIYNLAFFLYLVPAFISCHLQDFPCFLYSCFCFSPHNSFSFSFLQNKSSPCPIYLVYFDICFSQVWLEKASTLPDILKWDIRSTRPWRSLHTDYLCIKGPLFGVPREPALLPSLWQGLPSVHSQLSLLREGPGSATETGQGPTGKYIYPCHWTWRSWTLPALGYWCCKSCCDPAHLLVWIREMSLFSTQTGHEVPKEVTVNTFKSSTDLRCLDSWAWDSKRTAFNWSTQGRWHFTIPEKLKSTAQLHKLWLKVICPGSYGEAVAVPTCSPAQPVP